MIKILFKNPPKHQGNANSSKNQHGIRLETEIHPHYYTNLYIEGRMILY